ncbi:hypothetical protein [Trinickia fusca]|uniref:Uncharacterized protein n=1 Tax=Trinickia fusca TaxID=2419777 RepID=A0A494X8Q7_9BURK|nr:hypothetical protein [Trinickia fusca]RKP46840.1 hypothetical protein D7S89_15875 [Trinickia fusca]
MTTESPSAQEGPAAPAALPNPVAASNSGAQVGAQVGGETEIWKLLPVTLQFANVAANSNLNFTFTTVGVSWSLGARSGDSVGFSYNVTPSSTTGDSCIRQIEFNNAVMTIRTGSAVQTSTQAGYSFTLTLFLRVRPGVDYVQGYCTLNNEAVVLATIGSQGAVQWRNGRISAVLNEHELNYRPVSFTVKGARPGNQIDVIVSAKRGLGKVNWSLGPDFAESNGVTLASQQGQIPLTLVSYGVDTLSFVTSQPSGSGASINGSQTLEFFLNAYITWVPHDLNYIYLRTTCNSDISVLAQVNNRQPQIVSQTDTVFTL